MADSCHPGRQINCGMARAIEADLRYSTLLFVEASIQQLIEASKLLRDGVAITTRLSAALALITGHSPKKVQAALAVPVACLHTATINVLKRMHDVGERDNFAVAAAVAKLEAAFQGAIETPLSN
jgi:hypothetical protein